jgi:uncharacterized Fe-S cluster protein YjdI/CDGSH-type Zn-finger protein
MTTKIRRYTGKDIDVTFDVKRCIHAEECVRNLPQVFDTSRRPWIMPENSPSADRLAEVVVTCPTGAIHYDFKSKDQIENPPDTNTIWLVENGPIYVFGDLTIESDDGEFTLKETRAAFCRCGATHNKPFCDNSHKDVEFSASSSLEGEGAAVKITPLNAPGGLLITFKTDQLGSIKFSGPVQIKNGEDEVIYQGNRASLCTCSLSIKKPFCDASHRKVKN